MPLQPKKDEPWRNIPELKEMRKKSFRKFLRTLKTKEEKTEARAERATQTAKKQQLINAFVANRKKKFGNVENIVKKLFEGSSLFACTPPFCSSFIQCISSLYPIAVHVAGSGQCLCECCCNSCGDSIATVNSSCNRHDHIMKCQLCMHIEQAARTSVLQMTFSGWYICRLRNFLRSRFRRTWLP